MSTTTLIAEASAMASELALQGHDIHVIDDRVHSAFPGAGFDDVSAAIGAGIATAEGTDTFQRNHIKDLHLDWRGLQAQRTDAAALGIDPDGTDSATDVQRRIGAPPAQVADANQGAAQADEKEQTSDRETAAKLAESVELWTDEDTRGGYATVAIDGHFEHYPLRSAAFRGWLTRSFGELKAKAPSSDAISTALQWAEALAQVKASHPVYLRVAHHDGAVYVDLCDETWSAVKITAQGWEVVSEAPVKFRRTPGMKALPRPERGGSVDSLRPLVNAQDDGQWVLMLAWLLGSLSGGPFQFLALSGSAGVAKSTTARYLRAVVDPSSTPTRRKPKTLDDLTVAAKGSAVLVFDNLSVLSSDLSDALCTLGTGDGFGKRGLYTDDEERLYYFKRPVILTSVEEVVTRGDLNSRTSSLALPPITERQDESVLAAQFAQAHPGILGALFDATAEALRRRDDVEPPVDLRNRDWARWVMAGCGTLGFSEDDFLAAYDENRRDALAVEVETSPFANAVYDWMSKERPGGYKGTSTDFLSLVTKWARATELPMGDAWPKTPNKVKGRMDAHSAALAHVGVTYRVARSNGTRVLVVEYTRPAEKYT